MDTEEKTNKRPSIVTGKDNFEELYCFNDFPVYMGCTKSPASEDKFYDMKFEICKDSGVIQINDLPPLEEIYLESHHDATGQAWRNHNVAFCKFIGKYGELGKVFEIGGGNGLVAKEYMYEYGKCEEWSIIDPQPIYEGDEKIKMRKAWFDDKFVCETKPNVIVHSNVWEHAYDPKEFLRHTHEALELGGKCFISIPNLKPFLERKFVNTLNFEHNIFMTEEIADHFLKNQGFLLLDKEYYQGKDWVFYCVAKINKPDYQQTFPNRYNDYKKLFDEFVEHHLTNVEKLNHQIDKFDGEVYLFGAHIFSLFLLNVGLKDEKIVGLLDDSKLKNGRRLYGTNYVSQFSETIADKEKVAVILNVGQHRDVVVQNLLKINKNVVFIE